MSTIFKTAAFLTVLLTVALPTFVMAGGPGFGGGVNDGVSCPLDGGLSLLAVAGAGYCAKKVAARKKAKAESENAK